MLITEPRDLPDFTSHKRISVDLETCDPNLLSAGPGDIRLDGHVAGIGMAVEGGPAVYVPIGHAEGTNMPLPNATRWAQDQLGRANLEIVGARVSAYDRGWLEAIGVTIAESSRFIDVHLMEPLLDEHARSYTLGGMGKKYLGEGKTEGELYQWLAEHFGGRPTRRQQAKNIWRAPGEVVHNYGIGDVELPLRIARIQEQLIAEHGLSEVWALEQDIAHVVYYMRRHGVRVDVPGAKKLGAKLKRQGRNALRRLGKAVSVWSAVDLAKLYDAKGIEYPTTEERVSKKTGRLIGGKPSFKSTWLQERADEGCRLSIDILTVRHVEKLAGTFVEGYIVNKHHEGRVHGEFNQLRSDSYGTVSGRLSSSNPNLQNVPPEVRALFIPEEGEDWVKHDYSQIEPRLTLHYAAAQKVRDLYLKDPSIDCYQALLAEAPDGITRKQIKSVWLGTLYGMGKAKMQQMLGVSRKEAEDLLAVFHTVAPYVKRLSRNVSRKAASRGWIRTLSGRLARFPQWEPADFELSRGFTPRDTKEEVVAWLAEQPNARSRRVARAKTYVGLNRLIQGGAADIMKYAMVKQWRAGLWNTLGVPLVTVHDELDWSIPRTKEGREALDEARNIMTNAVELRLPLHVDEEIGPNWRDVK